MSTVSGLEFWPKSDDRPDSPNETRSETGKPASHEPVGVSIGLGHSSSRDISLTISQDGFRRFLILVIGTILSLALASYVFVDLTGHDTVLGVMHLLDVGKEQSLATFFAVFNILIGSALTFWIYRSEKLRRSILRFYWLALSALLLYMAIDESATIHEKFIHLQEFFFDDSLPMIPSHGWMLLGAVFAAIVGLAFIPFLLTVSRRTAVMFVIAGTIFLTGALGLEFVAAWMFSTGFADHAYLINRMPVLLEEGCELTGIAILNCTLLREVVERNLVLNLRGA